jgi:hypothetical protein
MQEINDNQLFLLLTDIELCPEIKTNSVGMVEQLMNAHLLLNKNNIQQGINRALDLEHFCKPFLSYNYLVLLEKITPLIEKYNIYIAHGKQVYVMYSKYNDGSKYYWDVSKQASINLEFALAKKVSYDGKNIKWESTFARWVDEIILEREERIGHNPNDKLIFSYIQQKVTDARAEIQDIILQETVNYTNQYREKLQVQ